MTKISHYLYDFNVLKIMRQGIILLAFFLWATDSGIQAQPSGFKYSFDEPVQIADMVRLEWTIVSGSTCNGMQILHSLDSIHFLEIGEVAGICGNANFDVPYLFEHLNPAANATNYYKIKFGQISASEVKQIYFLKLNNSGYHLFPNPVLNKAQLFFNNPQRVSVDLSVYHPSGQLVYRSETIKDNAISADLSFMLRGVYYFILRYESGEELSGSIMKI